MTARSDYTCFELTHTFVFDYNIISESCAASKCKVSKYLLLRITARYPIFVLFCGPFFGQSKNGYQNLMPDTRTQLLNYCRVTFCVRLRCAFSAAIMFTTYAASSSIDAKASGLLAPPPMQTGVRSELYVTGLTWY